MAHWQPATFRDVSIEGRFWADRLRVNRETTIPHEYLQCKETGRVDAFRLDWRPGTEPKPHFFWDSDLAKWIEAASYSLATHPDERLAALLDEVVTLVVSAQQPDGYLNVYFTVVEPEGRWTDTRDAHELYCAGHLIEAGVAHFQGTGQRTLLDAVCRYADHIEKVFGRGPGQKPGYCGHEEIELALVRLYRATGVRRYLHLAQFFVDERGRSPYWFEVERAQRGGGGHFEGFMTHLSDQARYNQSHVPVRDQSEAVGHSVRAMYLYSAMADLAGETGDAGLLQAGLRLWEDVTGRHMYITGGVGSSAANEGFTTDYDLPNQTAYAETCANVGLVFWAHRLLQIDCDGRYADVLERALYNSVISGVSAGGRKFFYANPLASGGGAHRQDWFGCACCPPNVARLLASLGGYVYSAAPGELAVHLYAEGSGRVEVAGHRVTVRQRTDYPWEGTVALTLGLGEAARFGLRLRIPGWCRGATLSVNGEGVDVAAGLVAGYVRVERQWQDGDRVELTLPMPVESMHAHPAVHADTGCVALQRGPLVYCLEGVDHPGIVLDQVTVQKGGAWTAAFDPALLGGVVALSGDGMQTEAEGWGPALYRPERPTTRPIRLQAVPYCAWDNRAPGAMRVWLREG